MVSALFVLVFVVNPTGKDTQPMELRATQAVSEKECRATADYMMNNLTMEGRVVCEWVGPDGTIPAPLIRK